MQDSRLTVAALGSCVLGVVLCTTTQADDNVPKFVPGYVTHGVNVFNDQMMVDYSNVSPTVPWLAAYPLLKEIGAFDPDEDATDAEVITEATDRSTPLATIGSFVNFFNPVGADPSVFNLPLDEVGVSPFAFESLDVAQRQQLLPFEQARPGDLYRAKGTYARPTVGDWEKAGGLIRLSCKRNGKAKASVTLRQGIPNGVYTLWDIGVLDPLTEQERGYIRPFGGLPNTLMTDSNGCGHKEMEVPFCAYRSCLESDSCTSYISAFYHWDAQIYGGSPAGTFAGAPVGIVASNHVVWPMSGDPLIEPQNPVSPRDIGCRGDRKDDDDDDHDHRKGRNDD